MKCFLQPDLKLDRLVIVCKFDGISSQRQGSEINMELKKEEVLVSVSKCVCFLYSFQVLTPKNSTITNCSFISNIWIIFIFSHYQTHN